LFTATLTTLPAVINGLTSTINVEAQSPSEDASNVYDSKTLTLGNNIKNLVILIPNEAHESQNPGDTTAEDRHIDQPYVPQNATVTEGTTVLWFNGDVDHDHKITLTGQGANPR
jgi:plastocyanin